MPDRSIDAKLELPINGRDIPDFERWVNWNGYSRTHEAFDFAAYMNTKGECVVGLPPGTPIRAIADGVVCPYNVFTTVGYQNGMAITYDLGGIIGSYMSYCHMTPVVKNKEKIVKGQLIGNLFSDDSPIDGKKHLVHLHFQAGYCLDSPQPFVEPILFRAFPKASKEFTIQNLPYQPKIIIANWDNIIGL